MRTEISPWLEKLREHKLVLGTIAAMLALAVAFVWVAFRWNIAVDRLEMLEKRAAEGFLQAPSSSRTVRIDPRSPRAITIGGGGFPERIDVRFNARTSRHARFRMSLARDDGTMLVHADQMMRDSNDDLRLSFNTSMLPAGRYLLRVEGYARGGDLQRFAEAEVEVPGDREAQPAR
jgi:hypothetical protein